VNGKTQTTVQSECSTSNSRDVALFGGAFDPLTVGHMTVMMGVYAQTGFPVWVMPCYRHLLGKEMAPAPTRLLMCQEVCELLGPCFSPFSYEINREHDGSTYETLQALRKDFPTIVFHFVVGTDNVPSLLTEWDRGAELLRENPVILVDRPGHEPCELRGVHPSSQHVAISFPSASRDVRSAIANKNYDMAKRQLPHRIWLQIEKKKLYGHPGVE
jgi:nicotinate (nicotinamide) nucleotide adenylyltransferase